MTEKEQLDPQLKKALHEAIEHKELMNRTFIASKLTEQLTKKKSEQKYHRHCQQCSKLIEPDKGIYTEYCWWDLDCWKKRQWKLALKKLIWPSFKLLIFSASFVFQIYRLQAVKLNCPNWERNLRIIFLILSLILVVFQLVKIIISDDN